MLLNILALVGMLAVALMSAVQGVYRAAQTLVALILAGAGAFALFGPVTGLLFSSSADPTSTWYYVADVLCLWAILCLLFLGLRTAAEKLLPVQPDFHMMVDRAAGAVVGLATGYLTVGLCMVLAQMLPTSPSFLGYEPFAYDPGTDDRPYDTAQMADGMWLDWDRAALGFFAYLAGGPLAGGDEETPKLFGRYGDVFPPPSARAAEEPGSVDPEDFLFWHWYRRWEYVRWRTRAASGPIPETPLGKAGARGLAIARGKALTLYGLNLRVLNVIRGPTIGDFADVSPPEGMEFLMVTLRIRPTSALPRTIDSIQFRLIDREGKPVSGMPLVHGGARKRKDEMEVIASSAAADTTLRNLRFAFPEKGTQGRYLADGATFEFTEPRQYESRTLVFPIPKELPEDGLRLFLKPNLTEADLAPLPPAGTAPGKSGTA